MKSLFCLWIVFLSFSPMFAKADCALTQPLNLGSVTFPPAKDKPLTLHSVSVDPAPKFSGGYDASKDKLELKFFNIKFGAVALGYLGARLQIEGKEGGIGFPDAYTGSLKVKSESKTDNKVTTYLTQNKEADDSTTELNMVVNDGQITKIEIKAGGQTLCVKSAKF